MCSACAGAARAAMPVAVCPRSCRPLPLISGAHRAPACPAGHAWRRRGPAAPRCVAAAPPSPRTSPAPAQHSIAQHRTAQRSTARRGVAQRSQRSQSSTQAQHSTAQRNERSMRQGKARAAQSMEHSVTQCGTGLRRKQHTALMHAPQHTLFHPAPRHPLRLPQTATTPASRNS